MCRKTLLGVSLLIASASNLYAQESADELDALTAPEETPPTTSATATDAEPPAEPQATPTIPVAATDAEPAPKPKARSSSRLVEEIVVTAQKREENLQDVPIAISAFSADQMDARGVTGVKDIGTFTPSLQFTDFAGYTLIYLRGIGTDTFIPSADPSVATYLDGVYFPAAHSLGQSFGALERVEVLKGPQGTLFGRNSTGGAISIVTKKPGKEAEGDVQLSFGRFNDLKGRLHVNIPLTDWLSTSVSGFYNLANSYYRQDNPNLPRKLPNDLSDGARLKIGIDPIDNVEIILTGLLTHQQGATAAVGVNTQPSALGTASSIQPETREYVTANDSAPSVATNIRSVYGQATWTGPRFDVKTILADFHVKTYDYQVDFDGSNRPLVTSQSPREFQDLQSAELQILSNGDTWLAERFKWIAGLYYFKSAGGYAPVFLSLAGSVVNQPGDNSLLSLLGPVPLPTKVGAKLYGSVGTLSYSGFLQGTLTVTDWFDLTLGGRYQDEKRTLLQSDAREDNADGSETTLNSFPQQSAVSKNFSPKLSLNFKVVDGLLVYLSYSQGFKSGTYNIVNLNRPPQYVQPEKVVAFELGAKAAFFDGLLKVNTAVFQNKITNLQASFISLFAGGAVQLENAGAARIRGVEVDGTWAPLPALNPGLAFTLSGSYLDAIYTDFRNGSGFDETTGAYSQNNDFTGNQISRVPKYTYTVGAGQTIDLPGGPLEVAGDYAYNNGYFFLAQNSPNSREPSYAVVSARVSYLYEPWQVRVTAFGNNLTDERYRVSQFFTDFGRLDTLAPPRTYGLRLNWSF